MKGARIGAPKFRPARRLTFDCSRVKALDLRQQRGAGPVDTRWLRRRVRALIDREIRLEGYELGIHLVNEPHMVRLNERYLRHAGVTDVIAFGYRGRSDPEGLAGDVVVCPAEARRHARRYRTDSRGEIFRYIVHGILHLLGHDDRTPAMRRRMKRIEDRWVRRWAGPARGAGRSDRSRRRARGRSRRSRIP